MLKSPGGATVPIMMQKLLQWQCAQLVKVERVRALPALRGSVDGPIYCSPCPPRLAFIAARHIFSPSRPTYSIIGVFSRANLHSVYSFDAMAATAQFVRLGARSMSANASIDGHRIPTSRLLTIGGRQLRGIPTAS